MHTLTSPSAWVTRWAHLIRPAGSVLDVACGTGRHSHWFARHGHLVTGVDRDAQALTQAGLHRVATGTPPVNWLVADIENEPWPLPGQTFDAVVVTNYLWRPLWPTLLAALAPGGVYIHETFAHGNATVGKPSRPDFLLQPGELWAACASFTVVAYECGFCEEPDRFVQRIVAVRDTATADSPPTRHHLTPPKQPSAG